jgi:hypothetical protein
VVDSRKTHQQGWLREESVPGRGFHEIALQVVLLSCDTPIRLRFFHL